MINPSMKLDGARSILSNTHDQKYFEGSHCLFFGRIGFFFLSDFIRGTGG
jgi:hypothetical protein